MSNFREKVHHPQHQGLIGEYNSQLKVAYCSWCAVGYSDIYVPQLVLERHFESRHPRENSNMWEEHQ